MEIEINIDPIAPLTDEEIKEINLHYDLLVEKIGKHHRYFARVGLERARLERMLGDAENEIKDAEIKVKEAESEVKKKEKVARDIRALLSIVSGYNDTAKSIVALLKDIKRDFPKTGALDK